jgi:hypothetical protein
MVARRLGEGGGGWTVSAESGREQKADKGRRRKAF